MFLNQSPSSSLVSRLSISLLSHRRVLTSCHPSPQASRGLAAPTVARPVNYSHHTLTQVTRKAPLRHPPLISTLVSSLVSSSPSPLFSRLFTLLSSFSSLTSLLLRLVTHVTRHSSSQDEPRIEGHTHTQAKTECAATQLKSAKTIPQQKHRRDHAQRTTALGMLPTRRSTSQYKGRGTTLTWRRAGRVRRSTMPHS